MMPTKAMRELADEMGRGHPGDRSMTTAADSARARVRSLELAVVRGELDVRSNPRDPFAHQALVDARHELSAARAELRGLVRPLPSFPRERP